MAKNLMFNSAICTSRSQSERLLELGLKKDTADMAYIYHIEIVDDRCKETEPDIYNPIPMESIKKDDSFRTWRKYIPAWSLHRLIELLGSNVCFDDFAIEWAYDTVIDHIAFDIRHDQFNYEYLKEKK